MHIYSSTHCVEPISKISPFFTLKFFIDFCLHSQNFNLKIEWKLKQRKTLPVLFIYFVFISSLFLALILFPWFTHCWCSSAKMINDCCPFPGWKILTNALALHIWCLATPPPRMIIPVLFAATAMLLILVISEIQFTPKVRTTERTVSVSTQKVCKPQETCFTLINIQL